jgi:DNA alkylation damage repair protein AlkB
MNSLHEVTPGAMHLVGFFDLDRQKELANLCFALGQDGAGFYQPVLRSGARMNLRMMCLGKHWNAKRYLYQDRREDVDGRGVQMIPKGLLWAAQEVATAAKVTMQADIAIVNYYSAGNRLGLHQDKDESPESLAAGIPVISVSLGDAADFLFGGISRRDPIHKVRLESGDAFVFGGPARMCYHGVARVATGTGPASLGLVGRINITFRQL